MHGVGTELAQLDRITLETSEQLVVRAHFERNVRAKPGGNGGWCDPLLSFFSGSAHADIPFSYEEEMA